LRNRLVELVIDLEQPARIARIGRDLLLPDRLQHDQVVGRRAVRGHPGGQRFEFEELGDALAHARSLSHERALGGALRSGADNPQVVVEESSDGLDTFRVRAKAMGKPRLAR
jgi:hypothetical protein